LITNGGRQCHGISLLTTVFLVFFWAVYILSRIGVVNLGIDFLTMAHSDASVLRQGWIAILESPLGSPSASPDPEDTHSDWTGGLLSGCGHGYTGRWLPCVCFAQSIKGVANIASVDLPPRQASSEPEVSLTRSSSTCSAPHPLRRSVLTELTFS